MSDPIHTTEAAQGPLEPAGAEVGPDPSPEPDGLDPDAVATGTDDPASGTGTDDPRIAALSREATRRRRQLHNVEAERDALRARSDSYERAEAERLAAGDPLYNGAGGLAKSDDLWLLVSLDELRGEDGSLDPNRVKATVAQIGRERPTWVRGWTLPQDGGASPYGSVASSSPSIGQAIKKAGGRR